jgi:hypothetical protein
VSRELPPSKADFSAPIATDEATALSDAVANTKNRKPCYASRLPVFDGSIVVWSFTAEAQSYGGVTLIANPGGGTIAFGSG